MKWLAAIMAVIGMLWISWADADQFERKVSFNGPVETIFAGQSTTVAIQKPAFVDQQKMVYVVDNKGMAGTTPITISAPINGANSYTLNTNYQSVMLQWNGVEFNVLGTFGGPQGAMSITQPFNVLNGATPIFSVLGDAGAQVEIGPSISLSATPYMDWHFGKNAAQDFNVRLQNYADERFRLLGLTAGTLADFGHVPANSPYPGGNLGSNAVTFAGSTLLSNSFPTSFGNAATTLCVLGGDAATSNLCPVMGSLSTDPSSAAWYAIGDSVGQVTYLEGSPPWFKDVAGSFGVNTFTPAVPLSGGQLAKLRFGQVLDSNDSPKCSGKITDWDAVGGTFIHVSGWYTQGFTEGTTPSCTPVGTQATVRFDKLYGSNIVMRRRATDQQKATVGLELSTGNYTGVDDTCPGYQLGCGGANVSDGGIDLVNLSANRSSFAYQIRGGKFVSGLVNTADATYGSLSAPATGNVQTYGFAAHPQFGGGNMGIAFSAQGASEAFRNWNGVTGEIFGQIRQDGNTNWGHQGATVAPYIQRVWTSGHGSNNGASAATNADATVTFSGGTGVNDGTMQIDVGNLNTSGTLGVGAGGINVTGDVSTNGQTFSGMGFKLPTKTVATLPTCNSPITGVMMMVNDASAPAWNATVAGGGAATAVVVCHGANWVVH